MQSVHRTIRFVCESEDDASRRTRSHDLDLTNSPVSGNAGHAVACTFNQSGPVSSARAQAVAVAALDQQEGHRRFAEENFVSKLFEALRKTEGAIRNLAAPVLSLDDSLEAPPARGNHESPEMYAAAVAEAGHEVRSETIDVVGHSPVLPFDGTDSRAAEQYRIIRTKILHHPAQPRMLMVSSPTPGDGKTLTAINLAGALALQEGVNVLLADGDFRRSSLAGAMGLNVSPGLGEVLKGSVALENALIRTQQIPNLYVLPSGDASPNPAELLASERWRAVLDVCRKEFGYIVFDAPPVAAVADYDLLQLACDGVVLVVRQDFTNRRLFQRALDIVPKAKQLGIVLNCVEDWFLWKTQGYYYYGNSSRK